MATKFEAGDPYQQKPLERRKIIEASHEAALKMAELLGQEANFHSSGAQSGQHAALPLPKNEKKSSQEIKLFLPNRETKEDKVLEDHLNFESQHDGQDGDQEQHYWSKENFEEKANLNDANIEDLEAEYMEEVENEELITDILERRLAYIYLAFQPPEPVEGPADTLFIVSRSNKDKRKVFIRAHSQVLKRSNDAFNELIGYRAPMIPTPSNAQEAEKTGMQISWHKEEDAYVPSKKSIYSKMLEYNAEERERKYQQAIYYNQNENLNQSTTLETLDNEYQTMEEDPNISTISKDLMVKRAQETSNPTIFEANKRQESQIGRVPQPRRESQASLSNERITLGLENVIGNLKDSIRPSIVKDFLDASQNLVQLPGWEHLPPDLKQSFEQFASEVNKFKNLEKSPKQVEADDEVDGKSLESAFLGMVGRRNSKEMLGILNNISQGIVERRASSILLEKAKQEELEGVPGNDTSAKLPRTQFEKRKSQAYIENQLQRESIATINTQKRRSTITNYDKRISFSFLERRKSKALIELARKKSVKFEAEEVNLRRRDSEAAVKAFERQRRMSALEDKRVEEVNFSRFYDRGSLWNPKPNAVPAFDPNKQKFNARSSEKRQSRMQSPRKSVNFENKNSLDRSENEDFTQTSNKERRPSKPPSLTHTRDEDREDVIRFYQEEDVEYYTSSSSSPEPEPTTLPKDVEFVIEKLHWTSDVLHGLMEFLYTETIHIHCEELPHIYRAANEILLSSLIDAIRLKPINQYYRLALTTNDNRLALLDLANQLTTSADYENYINKNEDFLKLKKLCEAFEVDGLKKETKPYTLLFETGHIAFRNIQFVTPGLHIINGQMMLMLRDPREGTRLYERNLEEDDYLTFKRKVSDRTNESPLKDRLWLGQWPPIEKTRNREKAWKIVFFDFKDLEKDIPLKNFVFYRHISSMTMLPIGKEEFSVRVVCGLLICPVLYKALYIAFPDLDIVAARGAGYFLGGETHGNNITMTGNPLFLLQACRALPRHMIGRSVLRVASPSEKTFIRLWKSTNRFGVDLECNVLYFLKPLIQIQKMLESWHNLDLHANYVVTHPREMVELVEPHDPF